MSTAPVDQAADRSKVVPDRTKLADRVLACVNLYYRTHEARGYRAIDLFNDGDPLVSAVAELQKSYPDALLPEPGQRLWAQLRAYGTNFGDEDETRLFGFLGDFRAWLIRHYQVGGDMGVPIWDANSGELRFRGQTLLQFGKAAPTQTKILDAFEGEGWPHRIDDPLRPGQRDPALYELRAKLKGSPLELSGDGTGKGIVWREVQAG